MILPDYADENKMVVTYLRAVVTRSAKRFSHVYILTTLIPDMISLIIRTLSSVREAVFALCIINEITVQRLKNVQTQHIGILFILYILLNFIELYREKP